ncbi:MAG: putative lipase, GDSL-type [Verrucomicrobiales bacterium]|nr:putative lipase, GDSL-type [Verrucomicrobiales bacterium]
MKKTFLICLVLALGLLGYFWSRPASYKNFPPTAKGDWIAYGDSLTSGYGAADGNDYPAVLSRTLGIPIRNFGVAGDTTEMGLKRVEEAAKIQPRVVLLCLGGNDGLQRMSSDEMFSNLRQMIRVFHQSGSFVILIGVRSVSLLDSNHSGFKKLANEEKVLYVSNILDGVFGSPSLMSDQVHPNDAGYKAIAERLATVLSPILPQLK